MGLKSFPAALLRFASLTKGMLLTNDIRSGMLAAWILYLFQPGIVQILRMWIEVGFYSAKSIAHEPVPVPRSSTRVGLGLIGA